MTQTLPSLFAPTSPVAPWTPVRWWFVQRRFADLVELMGIPQDTIDAGWTSLDRVAASLNRAYWGHNQATWNRIIGGSWGKQTRVHPTKDIDMLYLLPISTFHQFEARTGNKQSQLLQEVKQVLAEPYPRTTLRGDGQVVVVDLSHIAIEVVPAFTGTDGSLWICDTNNGGSYKRCDPWAEITTLDAADADTGGSTRHLARLAKLWRRHANVPIDSYLLERLAMEFLRNWPHPKGNTYWYDWMVRDFFAYLVSLADGWVRMPGTGEVVLLGSAWLSKAKSAHSTALTACIWEELNLDSEAALSWRGIFGAQPGKPLYEQ